MKRWSLRSKLLLACLLLQLLAGGWTVLGSLRLLEASLSDQLGFHARQVVALLAQSVTTPLAQRDYATLQQSLELLRDDHAITYLQLRDHRDRVIAASGIDAAQSPPPRDGARPDLDRADAVWHLRTELTLAEQKLGYIDLGLSTLDARHARSAYVLDALLVTGAALLVSLLPLAVIAYAVTRHLRRLADASDEVAAGRFDVRLAVPSDDEIGQLAAGFNTMAAALAQRVKALEFAEGQQRTLAQHAREEQWRLASLLAAMDTSILFVDRQGAVVYANPSFARIWSLAQPGSGARLEALVPAMARQLQASDAVPLALMLPGEHGAERSRAVELRTLDGRIVTQRAQSVDTVAGGGGWIWFHDDVTLQRQTQLRAQQALQDPLTQLLNRRGLQEALHAAVASATVQRSALAVMFIDLDDFKYANDVGGHQLGDQILVTVAHTLQAQLRREEVVARLGGDEFAVVCPGMDAAEAGAVAERLIEAVSALRFEAEQQTLRVGCSIGLASFPADAGSGEQLLSCADTAMYQAKEAGKNAWAAYRDDPRQSHDQRTRINWNTRLHQALSDDRFVLHFQPVVRTSDLRVLHHEALLRMVDEHDGRRLIGPAEFIEHAERSGKVRQLDRWVLQACVRRLAASQGGLVLAANLSARTLDDATFPGFLRELLQRHGVAADRLHLELTETAALRDAASADAMVQRLRALGCTIHLDDFGTGFNSFALCRSMGVDVVKIDGSFVRNLSEDRPNQLVVGSMVDFAHSLGKRVIAEHVEDEATLKLLRALGVDAAQGYHLGRPAAMAEPLPTLAMPL